jgi:uncharacterized protein (TIGR02246 family)
MEIPSMKYSRVIPFALLLAAVAGGFALTRFASAADDDAAGIKKSCEAVVSGWNKHDAKAIAAVFAEDADMITPDGRLVSGRAAIEKAFAEDHSGVMKESTVTVMKEPVRFPTADVAVSDAEVSVAGVAGPDGKKTDMTLVITNVWKKADGKWWLYACRPHVKAPPAK